MDRFEYKYLFPLEQLANLRCAVLPFVEADKFTQKQTGDYCVHSIYYDTCSLKCYHEKLAGIQYRKKFRVRGYNEQRDDSQIFLEIKRKNNKSISKNRAPFLFNNFQPLFTTLDIEKFIINGNGTSRAYDDAKRFFFQVYRYSLFPIICTHYNREAYFYKFDRSLRITIDKNLRSFPYPDKKELFREEPVLYSLQNHFILEVKFHDSPHGIPLWLENIIGSFGVKRSSLSKYTICLDTHNIPESSSARTRFTNGHI